MMMMMMTMMMMMMMMIVVSIQPRPQQIRFREARCLINQASSHKETLEPFEGDEAQPRYPSFRSSLPSKTGTHCKEGNVGLLYASILGSLSGAWIVKLTSFFIFEIQKKYLKKRKQRYSMEVFAVLNFNITMRNSGLCSMRNK